MIMEDVRMEWNEMKDFKIGMEDIQYFHTNSILHFGHSISGLQKNIYLYIVHLERNYAMSTFLKIHFFAIFELLDI